MPTLAAIRWNPVLRERHLQFKQRGKPGKVAVTAAMRKDGGDGECHDPGRQALATGSHANAGPQRGVKGTPDCGNRFATTTPSTCHRSLPISLKPNYLQTQILAFGQAADGDWYTQRTPVMGIRPVTDYPPACICRMPLAFWNCHSPLAVARQSGWASRGVILGTERA